MKISKLVLAVVLAGTAIAVVPSPTPARALTVSEVQARVKALRGSLQRVSAALEDAEHRLDDAQESIVRHRRALKRSQAQREFLREAVDRRAAALYMNGAAPSVLGTESSLGDVVDKIAYLEELHHGERGLLEDIRTLRHDAIEQSALLRDAQVRAQVQRAALSLRQRELSQKLGELSRLEQFLESVNPRTGSRASRGGVRGIWCPVVGSNVVSNNFGDPRPGGPHQGVDIRADHGQAVRAVLPGTVVDTPSGGWVGIGIVIRDLAGNEWWYAHLSQRFVSVGERVSGGEVMGRVGCTGRCYGPHLHFEFHPDGGSAVNPYRIAAGAC